MPDQPGYKVEGWVLEVEIGGPTGQLFKALSLVPGALPLLEPVGLRWGLPAKAGPEAGPHQYLLLRSTYLRP